MTSHLHPPRRVAILKPCCIGDCVMALPAIDALMNAWSPTTIDIYVGRHSRAVFAFRPSMSTRPASDRLDILSALDLSRQLRERRYDAVVNLDRSRWLRLASGTSRAPVVTGVKPLDPEMRHESEVYLDVVRSIGIATPTSSPSIVPAASAQRRADTLLNGVTHPFAVLHPGGAQNPGSDMLDKRWPVSRFSVLARSLRSDGVDVVVSGGPGDVAVARQLANSAGISYEAVLAGRADIETMAAVLDRAALYVGPDTGLSHIAGAVGVPTIAIFGPTNPRRYRPLGRNVQVLAPPASWSIPDRDLRHASPASTRVATTAVRLDEVLSATRLALGGFHEADACRR